MVLSKSVGTRDSEWKSDNRLIAPPTVVVLNYIVKTLVFIMNTFIQLYMANIEVVWKQFNYNYKKNQ